MRASVSTSVSSLQTSLTTVSDLRNRLRIMPVNWHFRQIDLFPKVMRSEAGRRRTGEQAAYTIGSITVAIDTQLRSKITRLPTW